MINERKKEETKIINWQVVIRLHAKPAEIFEKTKYVPQERGRVYFAYLHSTFNHVQDQAGTLKRAGENKALVCAHEEFDFRVEE